MLTAEITGIATQRWLQSHFSAHSSSPILFHFCKLSSASKAGSSSVMIPEAITPLFWANLNCYSFSAACSTFHPRATYWIWWSAACPVASHWSSERNGSVPHPDKHRHFHALLSLSALRGFCILDVLPHLNNLAAHVLAPCLRTAAAASLRRPSVASASVIFNNTESKREERESPWSKDHPLWSGISEFNPTS